MSERLVQVPAELLQRLLLANSKHWECFASGDEERGVEFAAQFDLALYELSLLVGIDAEVDSNSPENGYV
jgi:hypothetical protein